MSHLFVLVFTLVWTLVHCGCPTMCRCKNYAQDSTQTSLYTVATCDTTIMNLTDSAFEQIEEVTLRNLSENLTDSLAVDIFETMPNLRRLSLKNSTICITNLTLPSKIIYLDLSGNNVGVWSTHRFHSIHTQILDISDNHLDFLEEYSFRTMDSIEVLNISFNNISVIQKDTFNGLDSLKCLDLSANSIGSLSDQVFDTVTSLQYLNLTHNNLNTLSEICFGGLTKLQHLDISWNNLQKLALGSLELPNLARLSLAGNENLGKNQDSQILVSTGRKLQTVDASHIGLQQVPPSLTPSIRALKLTENKIRKINCGDLDSYPLLQLLDLTSNGIDFIEEDAIGRLDSLTMLFLTDNKITEIPRSLPERLKILRVERNNLVGISEGDLQGLTKLEVLLLNDNKIRIIEAKAFLHLTSLVTLDLSKNPLSVLQPGCLLGPISLQVLRLSEIDLISPAKDVSFPLSAPEHLITLDLSNSPGLTRQFLADTAVLAASKQLQELDLSHTNLDEIRSDLFHYLPQLRSLHLDDNKLNCSNLHWLASWMRKQDEREYRKIICASPAELWGTLLTDLQDEENEIPNTTVALRLTTTSTRRTKPVHFQRKMVANNLNNNVHRSMSTSTTVKISSMKHINKIKNITTGKISDDYIQTEPMFDANKTSVPELRNSQSVKTSSTYTKVIDSPVFREKSTTLFVDIMPNTYRHWNGTADELSATENVNNYSFHPGMIISFVGVLGTISVILIFLKRITGKVPIRETHDIEVNSLPSVTELW